MTPFSPLPEHGALFVGLIVILFSVVQSIFGVGLLVFGTPVLLFAGYSFEHTLLMLLPCSLTISFLQITKKEQKIGPFEKRFILYCVPALALGLTLLLLTQQSLNARLWVGLLLLINGFIRLSKGTQLFLSQMLQKNLGIYLAGMGLVHGLTNMGGGLLTVLINSLYSEKNEVRGRIAFGYLIMAATQLIVLLVFKNQQMKLSYLIYPLLAGTTYVLLGNRLFHYSSQAVFQKMVTALIILFGVCLVVL